MSTLTADMNVGQRIKWARRQTGISQERLASQIGTTRQVVIRWERGKHLPNAQSRDRLGDALGQEPEFFADTEAALSGEPFRNGSGRGPDGTRQRKTGEQDSGEAEVKAA